MCVLKQRISVCACVCEVCLRECVPKVIVINGNRWPSAADRRKKSNLAAKHTEEKVAFVCLPIWEASAPQVITLFVSLNYLCVWVCVCVRVLCEWLTPRNDSGRRRFGLWRGPWRKTETNTHALQLQVSHQRRKVDECEFVCFWFSVNKPSSTLLLLIHGFRGFR